MKNQVSYFLYIFFLISFSIIHPAQGQENYASKIEKEILSGNVMHITFEIVAGDNTRFFYVILEAVSNGQKIKIAEAYGNIGHRQQAGKNEIIWYYKKDFEGDINNVEMNVYAFKENEPRALAKVLSISNDGVAPCEVTFANNSLYANQYEWDFGDVESGASNHSLNENPAHMFAKRGIYTTTLIARNTDLKMEETWVYTIEIREPPAPVEEVKAMTPEQPEVKKEVTEPVKQSEPVIKEPVIVNSGAQKHKTMKMIWLGSAIASAGFGGFSYLQANSAYDKYTKSTDNNEAENLRKKFKSNDVIYPVAFIISGICISQVILQAGKQKKAQNNLSLHVIPVENGGVVGLTWNF
jgi:PKD repeat protein